MPLQARRVIRRRESAQNTQQRQQECMALHDPHRMALTPPRRIARGNDSDTRNQQRYGPGTKILSTAEISTFRCSVRMRKLRSSPFGFLLREVTNDSQY